MIETTVLRYLAEQLDAPVLMEEPEETPDSPRPVRYVLIEKTGSGVENHIRSAVIAAQSWAPSLYEAALLNERVKAALDAMPEHVTNVSRCRLNSDYNFTDPQTHRYRYQAVYDLIYMED